MKAGHSQGKNSYVERKKVKQERKERKQNGIERQGGGRKGSRERG